MGRKKSHVVVSAMPKRDPCQDSESPHRNIKTRKKRNSLKTEEKKVTNIVHLLVLPSIAILKGIVPHFILFFKYHILDGNVLF